MNNQPLTRDSYGKQMPESRGRQASATGAKRPEPATGTDSFLIRLALWWVRITRLA